MNVVFWAILILALIFIWLTACSIFKPLGLFISRIFNDVIDMINENDKGNKNV